MYILSLVHFFCLCTRISNIESNVQFFFHKPSWFVPILVDHHHHHHSSPFSWYKSMPYKDETKVEEPILLCVSFSLNLNCLTSLVFTLVFSLFSSFFISFLNLFCLVDRIRFSFFLSETKFNFFLLFVSLTFSSIHNLAHHASPVLTNPKVYPSS